MHSATPSWNSENSPPPPIHRQPPNNHPICLAIALVSLRSLRFYSLARSLATVNPAGYPPDNFHLERILLGQYVLLSFPFRIE